MLFLWQKFCSSIKNNSCYFNNWCRNSKENTWSWNNNFNNLKKKYDILNIVQAVEDSNILLEEATETIKDETKEQKGGCLSTLLGTLE